MLKIYFVLLTLILIFFSSEIFSKLNTSDAYVSEAYFRIGQGFANEGKDSRSCYIFLDHRKFICLEGFYFESYKKNRTHSSNLEKIEQISSNVGKGMFLGLKDISISGLISDKFQADGWAFSRNYTDSTFKNEIINSCKKKLSSQDLQKYCLWGAGRAFFFKGYKISELKKYPNSVISGFKFAEEFNKFSSNINYGKNEKGAKRIANFLRNYFSGNLTNLPDWFVLCEKKYVLIHPLDCLH